MAGNAKLTYKDYLEKLADYELCSSRECTAEEKAKYDEMFTKGEALPDNVIRNQSDTGTTYTIVDINDGLTHEQLVEYLLIKENEKLSKIKQMLIFFTVLTVIGLLCGVIIALL